jgi:hypothetical protein
VEEAAMAPVEGGGGGGGVGEEEVAEGEGEGGGEGGGEGQTGGEHEEGLPVLVREVEARDPL